MRTRDLGGAMLVAVCVATALVPASATAASGHTAAAHRITINVAPRPITAGDPIVIYGRLFGPNSANKVVHLYHRVAGQRRFSFVQNAFTDSSGAYEFPRADGVVDTNRSLYVRSMGARSRTIYEPVMAQVTLQGPANGSDLLTGPAHPYSFSGTVTPATVGARVILQRQNAASGTDDWHQIDAGRVSPGGQFTIVHHFVVPGDANIRVLVRGNQRNAPSPSSVLNYQVSQAEIPGFSIAAAPNPIAEGGSVTVTGQEQGAPGQSVSLLAHTVGQPFTPVATATTDANGNYTFPAQAPVYNTYYQVRGAAAGKHSAVLFEGVRDVLSAAASASTVQAGQAVTFSGSVAPSKAGNAIYLQQRNANGGDFHTVQKAIVEPNSTYSITHTVYVAGTKVFRVLIPGGPLNQGAASQAFTVQVTPATAAALTPAQG